MQLGGWEAVNNADEVKHVVEKAMELYNSMSNDMVMSKQGKILSIEKKVCTQIS